MSDQAQCRICLAEINKIQSRSVVKPCQCKGSIEFVHQTCLRRWVVRSRKLTCSVCLYKYQLRKKIMPLKIVIKKLQKKKTLMRLQIRLLEYGLWIFLLYQAIYNGGKLYREQMNLIRQGVFDKQNEFLGQKPPLLIAVVILVWLLGMLKYTQFVFGLFHDDFFWCKRLRSRNRFINYKDLTKKHLLDRDSNFDSGSANLLYQTNQ